MKVYFLIVIIFLPRCLFSQFTKSFTDVYEYRFSNDLVVAVETENFHYGMSMLDSVLAYTEHPDKVVIEKGIACCLKTNNKNKLQALVSIASMKGQSLQKLKKDIEAVFPDVIETNASVFAQRLESVRLFALAELLAQMLVDDQVCRSVTWKPFVDHSEKLGYKVSVDHFKTEEVVDSVNTVLLDSILIRHPDISKADVGSWGMVTIFSVIQHSRDIQRYEPFMERWYRNKDMPASNYALFTDRLLTDQGKPQRYGTQLYSMDEDEEVFFETFENVAKVEAYRMEVGLMSIQRYAKSWGIDWEEYVRTH